MCAGGPVGVGDLLVWGICGCQGQVGDGYKRVWRTFVCRGFVLWGTFVPDSKSLVHLLNEF